VVLIAFLALVVDVGQLQYWKPRAQNAADAAAIGAVQELITGGSSSQVVVAGRKDAEANGMLHGQSGVTVTINTAPRSGEYAGISRFVEAIVTRNVALSFMYLLNRESATVAARAVASVRVSEGCIYAMESSGSGTFSASGSSQFSSKCAIFVRSNNSGAMQVGNAAGVAAPSVWVVGGLNGAVNQSCPPSGVAQINTGAAPFDDPFKNLPSPPSGGACDFTDFVASGTVTLTPGVYCNGIRFNGGQATLTPGLYVIRGGGISSVGGAPSTAPG
jgi:Flp pilus assembly protein TadG